MALGQLMGQPKEAPAIYLAAFGKHPGWDDHIEDLGIETDHLAQVRRWLYIDGISGNIDSGAWEKLAGDQRLAGFAHDFVWWFGGSGKGASRAVVGRLWSSSDGKGRTKYPMAVYSEGVNIPIATMARDVMPALVTLERRCVEASSSSAVRMVIDQARADLRSGLERGGLGTEGAGPAEVLTPAQVGQLVDRPEFGAAGPVREGLARVLYAMERELGPFLPMGGDGRKSKSISAKPTGQKAGHLRLPSLAEGASEACLIWISLLSRRLAEGSAILAISPRGEKFVDVVVGEPGAAQLYCVRASARGFPLTTEVPYVIDEAFKARCVEMIGRWRGEEPPSRAGAPAAAARPAPAAEPAPGAKPKSKARWFLGGGAGVVIVGVTAAVMMSGGDKKKAGGAGGDEVKVAINDRPSGPGEKGAAGSGAPGATADPEKPDPEKARREREAGEQAARDKAAQEKLAREKAAADTAAKEAAEREEARKRTLAAQKAEQERLDREAAAKRDAEEKDRVAREAAQKQEQDRISREQADRQARETREKQDREKLDQERLDQEKRDKEKQDQAALEEQRALIEKDLGRIRAALADGLGAEGRVDGGATVRDAYDGVRASAAFGAVANSQDAVFIADRMSALAQVAQSNDAGFLAPRAAQAGDGKLAVSVAAAERLGQLASRPWPSNAEEGRLAADIVASNKAGAAGIKDAARAAGVNARVQAAARRFWMNWWRAVDRADDAGVRAVIGAMEPMGVVEQELAPADRYSILAAAFRRVWPAARDDEARALAAALVEDASKVGPLPEAASNQVKELAAALAEARTAAAQGPPVDTLGPGSLPGSKRWTLESAGAGGAVFAPPAGSKVGQSVAFVRVHTPEGDAYVQTQEMSLGLFLALVDESGNWPEVARLGRMPSKAGRDGPVVWDWEIGASSLVTGITPASTRNRTNSRGWFDFESSGVMYFESGGEPAQPGLKHPMQYMSPAAAVYVSRLAGCRLPTVKEMSALIALPAEGTANRRDAAWYAATQRLAKVAANKNCRWFDGGIFPVAAAQGKRRDKAPPAVEQDDGIVLFREVDAGGSKGVHDAVGNVAELVFADPGVQGTMPGDAAGLVEAASKFAEVRVMGASALSPQEEDPAEPQVIRTDPARSSFSDVGFRLAFSAVGTAAGGAAAGTERLSRAAAAVAPLAAGEN